MEWNDRFRDTMRGYWLHNAQPPHARGDFALRLCGSSDLYQRGRHRPRPPTESVNYIVSHDGFTLRDLVSYNTRHNQANGENNADGHSHNLSYNCGVEGHTDDAAVLALRSCLQRALLATTLLAQGTPMLCAGDELGHSQGGNNNPYCQDNDTTWLDWAQADQTLIAFTTRVLHLRRQLLPLGDQWYSGLPATSHEPADLAWMRANGEPLEAQSWNDTTDGVLGCLIGKPGRATTPLLLLFNPDSHDCPFALPPGPWQALLDTAHPEGETEWQGERHFLLRAHSLALLAVHTGARRAD
jgi:glycogen operon protein